MTDLGGSGGTRWNWLAISAITPFVFRRRGYIRVFDFGLRFSFLGALSDDAGEVGRSVISVVNVCFAMSVLFGGTSDAGL